MNRILRVFLILAIQIGLGKLAADNRLVLYLTHPPAAIMDKVLAQLPAVRAGGRIGISGADRILPLGNIMSVYAGYVDISNPDGLISFPLRHTKLLIYLLVTPRLHLVKAKGHTVSHREIVPDLKARSKRYECTLQNDAKLNVMFWTVKEVPLPDDNKVNPLEVVLLTDPVNLYVPQGDFPAAKEPHLVLPPIYLIGSTGVSEDLSANMAIMQYFEPSGAQVKKPADQLIQRQLAAP